MRRAWVGKWCTMGAVSSGVSGCCRRRAWLLKYRIYEILHRKARKERKVKVTTSLRALRPLPVDKKLYHRLPNRLPLSFGVILPRNAWMVTPT